MPIAPRTRTRVFLVSHTKDTYNVVALTHVSLRNTDTTHKLISQNLLAMFYVLTWYLETR